MSYRLDNRTEEQFIDQIKQCSEEELDIAIRVCIFLKKEKKKEWPRLEPHGTDFTGEFKSKAKVDADFLIDDILTEITKSSTKCKKFFHQKTSKVNYCLLNDANIVFVNDYKQDPMFTIIPAKDLGQLTKLSMKKYGIV